MPGTGGGAASSDVAERVLEIVLASLDEPQPKPGLTRIRRNLYRRGILSRSKDRR